MNKIYTIGFTQKTAEEFFNLIEKNKIRKLIDVRLKNNSQLSAFSKYPDIKFFLHRICSAEYFHDKNFAPTEKILNDFKNKVIDWTEYEIEFSMLMRNRNIEKYIAANYLDCTGYCFLCSEPTPENCHRRLIAEKFKKVFADLEIIHL